MEMNPQPDESFKASLARLADLDQAHLELAKQMFDACGGAMYGMDLLAAGALNRSRRTSPDSDTWWRRRT